MYPPNEEYLLLNEKQKQLFIIYYVTKTFQTVSKNPIIKFSSLTLATIFQVELSSHATANCYSTFFPIKSLS